MQMSLFETSIDEKMHETLIVDLKIGTGFVDGKERITEIFQKNLPKNKTIGLLKDEYGCGGRALGAVGMHSQHHCPKGIEIKLLTGESKWFAWSQVYEVLSRLIETGEYHEGIDIHGKAKM